jgi:hypothetical protein
VSWGDSQSNCEIPTDPRRVGLERLLVKGHGRESVPCKAYCNLPGRRSEAVYPTLGPRFSHNHWPVQWNSCVHSQHWYGLSKHGFLRARSEGMYYWGYGRRKVLGPFLMRKADQSFITRSPRLGSCGALIDIPVGSVVVPKASIAVTRNLDCDFINGSTEDEPYRISKQVLLSRSLYVVDKFVIRSRSPGSGRRRPPFSCLSITRGHSPSRCEGNHFHRDRECIRG